MSELTEFFLLLGVLYLAECVVRAPRGAVGAHVTLWQPAHGGHVGFPTGRWPAHVRALPERVAGWLAERL